MKILISWIAYHEDFIFDQQENRIILNTKGPNSAFHKNFYNHDKHLILHSGGMTETRVNFLANHLKTTYKNRSIDVINMNIDDPINVKEIMAKVTILLAEFKNEEIEAYISPGTPAMQVSWYLIHLNPVFKISIFQTREARFTKDKKPEIIKISLNQSLAPVTALLYQNEISKKSEDDFKITDSKKKIYDDARLVAQTPNVTVLIHGESGTGKENLANYIHRSSSRSIHPYIPLNCSALGDQLLESRLFGYKKGAFTGAEKDTPGIFEQASKGTIFLDEIGDISPYMQQSLLRVIQEKKVMYVGGGKQIDVDVRIIAATNKNLVEMCKDGSFRWDLYYRLAVVELELPPLRAYPVKEAKELILFFLKKIAKDLKKNEILKPDSEALSVLLNYAYPGNIRELENIISRLYVFNEGVITSSDLPNFLINKPKNMGWLLAENEKCHIANALDNFKYNQRQTAIALGITINTLKAKMKKYDLKI